MNWFLSAMAQSTAAIVGIAAAFIITSIVRNRAEFQRKHARLRELLSLSRKYETDAQSRYFEWYNRHRLTLAKEKLRSVLKEDEEPRTPEGYYSEMHFPEFLPRQDMLKVIRTEIASHEASRSSPGLSGGVRISLPEVSTGILNRSLQESLHEEHEAIGSLRNDICHHIDVITDFSHEIEGDPEASRLITWLIATLFVLFLGGVVHPLALLPMNEGTHLAFSLSAVLGTLLTTKGWFLGFLTFVFLGLAVVFIRINEGLRQDREDVLQLEHYTEPGAYSEFFQIMEQNAVAERIRHEERMAALVQATEG